MPGRTDSEDVPMDEAPTSHQPEEEEEEEGQDSTEQEEEEEEEPQRVKIVSLLSAYASKFFSPIMGDVTGVCVREREKLIVGFS